jgi:hypothetical protein
MGLFCHRPPLTSSPRHETASGVPAERAMYCHGDEIIILDRQSKRAAAIATAANPQWEVSPWVRFRN